MLGIHSAVGAAEALRYRPFRDKWVAERRPLVKRSVRSLSQTHCPDVLMMEKCERLPPDRMLIENRAPALSMTMQRTSVKCCARLCAPIETETSP